MFIKDGARKKNNGEKKKKRWNWAVKAVQSPKSHSSSKDIMLPPNLANLPSYSWVAPNPFFPPLSIKGKKKEEKWTMHGLGYYHQVTTFLISIFISFCPDD